MLAKRGPGTWLITGSIFLLLILLIHFGIDAISGELVEQRLRKMDPLASVGSVLFSPSTMLLSRVRFPGSDLTIHTMIVYWNGDPFSPRVDSVLMSGGEVYLDNSGSSQGGDNRRDGFPPGRFSEIRVNHGNGESTLVTGTFSGGMTGDSLSCILQGDWGRGVASLRLGAPNNTIEVSWFQCFRLPEEVARLPRRLQGFDVEGRMDASWGEEFEAEGVISKVDGDPAEIQFRFRTRDGESDVTLTADLSSLRDVLVSQAESLLDGVYIDFVPSGSVELAFENCDTVGVMVNALLDSVAIFSSGIHDDTVHTSSSLCFSGSVCLNTWSISVDSGTITFGNAPVNFSLDGNFSEGRRLEMRLWNEAIMGEALSGSIPEDLLGRLSGLRLGGKASFDIGIVLDWENPDSSDFTASVDVSDLTIESSPVPVGHLRWGGTVLMRDSWGGSSLIHLDTLTNQDFLPFNSLHPSFEGILRCAEDATFRSHGGFCIYHIRNSIIADIKAGSFTRGGSTITMQLARNLFLGREKTLARKLQEVFLTWRLESYLSKNRMLEIYANIVELGPGVFGFDEAALHYFGRRFSSLSTREVAYLVSILPGPSLYYRFYINDRVPGYWEDYLDRLINISAGRGWINRDSALSAVTDSIVFMHNSESLER